LAKFSVNTGDLILNLLNTPSEISTYLLKEDVESLKKEVALIKVSLVEAGAKSK